MPLLTSREIKLIAFVVGAALLGFGVQHYRGLHSAQGALNAGFETNEAR